MPNDSSGDGTMLIRIRKGLTIPIKGRPVQAIDQAPAVRDVALLGADYPGLLPNLLVGVGDRVKLGQPVVADRNVPEIRFNSPGCGTVREINRGPRRVLQSIVIDLEGDEEETFGAVSREQLTGLSGEKVREKLLASGLWSALRTRPFSKVPRPETEPHSIFITAIDTNPLAPDPALIIAEYVDDFVDGLTILTHLTSGQLFICAAPDTDIPSPAHERISVARFAGPHPAGLVGTHIHFLDPVSAKKTVWHLGYQDVIAIGKLFSTGRLWVERTISLAGPVVKQPRLLRTRMGASITDLVRNELLDHRSRLISGPILSGYAAGGGWGRYLGRYHQQISVLRDGREREFLGWLVPGFRKHSKTNAFASSLIPGRRFDLTTSTNGSPRAMVPIGSYDKVMPLDILPALLLKALIILDTDAAKDLGALELDEEDLALCSYVCASKNDFGPILRANLERLEKEI